MHDTHVRERNFGVWKLWEELQTIYPNHLEFVHSHGLGVLQLNDAPCDKRWEWLQPGSSEKQGFKNYFAALGSRQLERFELNGFRQHAIHLDQAVAERVGQIAALDQTVHERDGQVAALNHVIVERDGQIVALNHAVSERDGQIASLNQSVRQSTGERDLSIAKITAMRSSWSWKLTSPLRLLSHLAHGRYGAAQNAIFYGCSWIARQLPHGLVNWNGERGKPLLFTQDPSDSSSNFSAISALIAERCGVTQAKSIIDPLCPPAPLNWPMIDVSVVTYNNRRWIEGFVHSLLEIDYPKERLTIRFVDNSSTDSTLTDLHAIIPTLRYAGCQVEILKRKNHGFGSGHNTAIRAGSAPFCLITNIDLTFEVDALCRVVATALADHPHAASWELRQKPYEHPKFYDPITGTTNWNAHACILLRRSSVEAVGGYDETLFMYGEDVELSYRLRQAGYLLRYCPRASVWHYSYEHADQVKPLQYTGSTFANLYLRLKYGTTADARMVPRLAQRLLSAPMAYPGSRGHVLRNMLRLLWVAPRALLARKHSEAYFPFRTWDYEVTREGAFVEQHPMPVTQPLISIITRTYLGRDLYLRQAMLSVAHQTWDNLEHIVVEDGGETMRGLVEETAKITGRNTLFVANGKHGRSSTGNAGLAVAKGRWCLFLDDDDLLFADHIEVLATVLLGDGHAVASYSLAWEVITDSSRLAEGHYMETTHDVPTALRQNFDFDVLLHHNYMAIQSVLFERALFLERGGFEEDMDALEDWTLWACYAYRNRFVYVPKVTSMFRTPADPVTIQKRTDVFKAAHPVAVTRIAEKTAWVEHEQSAGLRDEIAYNTDKAVRR
jgi:GT2 family glycosyltransferase